jgi:FMN phosphatase YigB (HAD superfamily)
MSFDFVITAQDVQSYKPARGHFHRLFESHAELGKTLHVAQSLFHDGEPAQELGLPFVWINRYGEANRSSVNSPTTFVDLKSLADVAGNL